MTSLSAVRLRRILPMSLLLLGCGGPGPTGDAMDMGGEAGCMTDPDCSDGDLCNGIETCSGGVCQPGAALACDDGRMCNGAERCDAGIGCVQGVPLGCGDGLYCNGVEGCDEALGCVPGVPPVLDDGVSCTVDACDESADLVIHPPDAGACDDGLFCSGIEVCDTTAGCAAGTPPPVDDGIACTADRCDEATDTIVNAPNDAACDDGDPCTSDSCVAGVGCVRSFVCACRTAAECNDGNPCTNDTCTGGGTCSYANNTAPCDDGLFCNGGDVCSGGACTHAGNPCAGGAACANTCNEAADDCFSPAGAACTDDGNPCTSDVCSGSGACTHPPNTAPCDDGLFCNGADACSGGACTHAGDPCLAGAVCANACSEAADNCLALAGAACPDSTPADCLTPGCDGAGTCDQAYAAATTGASCDDGLFCNGADVCSGGACTHAGDPCAGGAACANTCSEAADNCHTPADAACTDDGNPCTSDVCSGSGACTHPPNTAPCDDGLFCNGADACSGGACTHAGDPCLAGAVCSNTCSEAADDCLALAGAACPDSTPADCLTPGCDGAGTCDQAYVAATTGASCDDGLFCNGADTCDASAGCTAHIGDPCAPRSCDEVGDACGGPPTFVSIAAGGSHTCALTAAGGAYCWGSDATGQLGNGGTSAGTQSPSAVDTSTITGTRSFVQIAAGSHTCAVTAAGVAYCWGSDARGQLGNGGTSVDAQSPSAVDTSTISGSRSFVQLTAGSNFTCGVSADGTAYCWGWDTQGQLGNGGTSVDVQSPSAVDTSAITGNRRFVQVTAGRTHACGLTADGAAYCWGSDWSGMLGNGGTDSDTQSPSSVDTSTITGNRAFVQLVAGHYHTCGLLADGAAYCWGNDSNGQLGNGGPPPGANEGSPSAVDTSTIAGARTFVRLTAGAIHTCGLTADGATYCWGNDQYGKLGNGGTALDAQSPSAIDTSAIAGTSAFIQVSAGLNHSCGLAADGVPYCWGQDSIGQLGDGGVGVDTQSPSAVDLSPVTGIRAFVQLTTGPNHTCGRTPVSVAYCWGSDSLGQLGNGGSSVDTQSPSAVDTAPIAGNRAIVRIASSSASLHSCGVTVEGAAYCWGADNTGQLGNGGGATNTQSPSPVDTAPISGNRTFVQIATGDTHGCGLTGAGVAYCWGFDDNGQLGNGGSSINTQSPSAVSTTPIAGNRAFVLLTAGALHTCGLTADGVAYCWGSDSSGQLGNGGTSINTQSPSAVDTTPIAGNRAFVLLTAGGNHTCGLTAEGVAYCWGADGSGQLGNGGTSVNTQSPSAVDTVPIVGSRLFRRLSAGYSHTCGLTADGVAYCWGRDFYGQLGNAGTSVDTQSPSAMDTVPISGDRALVQLAAGANHTCGLTADGVAYCWGRDNSGQLGNGGTAMDTQSPSAVETFGL